MPVSSATHPFVLLVVLIDRRLPGLLWQGGQHLVHGLADPMAERESDLTLAGRIGQVVAGAGGIRLGEDVALNRALGQLLRRQMRQLEVTDKAADA